MAIKDEDWNIISVKALKRYKKKKSVEKTIVWKEVYWIEGNTFALWVGTIISQEKEVVVIDCLNRSLKANPNKIRTTRKMNVENLTFEKK